MRNAQFPPTSRYREFSQRAAAAAAASAFTPRSEKSSTDTLAHLPLSFMTRKISSSLRRRATVDHTYRLFTDAIAIVHLVARGEGKGEDRRDTRRFIVSRMPRDKPIVSAVDVNAF